MVWKKDGIRPTQPYFVFDTEDFSQQVYLQEGISHFYTFRVEEDKPLRLVPDGCIDLFFEYRKDDMHCHACGTKLKYSCDERVKAGEIFGVRFMPGTHPELLQVTMRELLEHKIPIKEILTGDADWLARIGQETDFGRRTEIFLTAYANAQMRGIQPFGKKELVRFVKQMVYDSDGKVKVSQMQEQTGYSERYINKVFLEEMGFPPKTFCKIIQFQRALEFLNYGAPGKMTDAAVSFGYYDEPQFIRDFKKYAGITPKKYLKLVEGLEYKNKIQQTKEDKGV